jgi:hypothetical protein
MGTYREHRRIIALLVLIWVAMCGGALSATGKIDTDLHQASQWLLGKTVSASQAVLPGIGLEIVLHSEGQHTAQCRKASIERALATESASPGKSMLPELTYYM